MVLAFDEKERKTEERVLLLLCGELSNIPSCFHEPSSLPPSLSLSLFISSTLKLKEFKQKLEIKYKSEATCMTFYLVFKRAIN